MSSIIGIMGQSGSGKTTSLRKLDPATTFIIDADRKGLSWQGWKRSYVEGKNYLRESKPEAVQAALNQISTRMPHIKLVIIDTVNSIMVDDEMRRMKDKGYDKWADLAQSVYQLISDANVLRDDLIIAFTFHCEVFDDELGGNKIVRFQTNGRKLQKITLEGKFPVVLFAKAKGNGEYIFETQSKQSVAKSPIGMFADFEIPNDLALVAERVRAFDSEDGPLESVANTLTAGADAFRKASPEEAFKKHEELFGVLIGLQERDGIVNHKLIEFLKSNDMFEGCKKLDDLSDELLVEMCKPENWSKVVGALKPKVEAAAPAETPAAKVTTIGDVFDTVTQIRAAVATAKLKDEELSAFMLTQGMIDKGQAWWDAGEDILNMMVDKYTWNNIVLTITKQPF